MKDINLPMQFEPKNRPIVLKASGDKTEQMAFVRNLCDTANEKINHFDRLRQQVLNYALVVFSALLAFVMKAGNAPLQIIGCFGIAGLMVIFRFIDHRYHTFTHGFNSSIIIFNQVIAHILNDPSDDVSFYQYYKPGEKTTQ